MKKLLLSVLIISGAGCSKSSNSSEESAPPFSGTFTGQESGTQNGASFNQNASFILTQTGSAVTGSWTSQTGGSGTLSGTAAGSTIDNLTIMQTDGACPGSYSGKALVNGSSFTASFTGAAANCGNVAASINANKL